MSSPTHTSVASTRLLLGCAEARLGNLDLARQHGASAQQALAATLANPNRFKNKPPKLPKMPTAAWINPPPEEKKALQ